MSPNWFLAFPVDPNRWYQKIITNVPSGIKCFNQEDLHVTLAFLGPAGEERARRAWREACQLKLTGVDVMLGPMEPFGNPEQPSAYAFTLDKGREEVVSYIASFRDGLLEIAGRSAEQRKPRPHVTIARPPRGASATLRAEGLRWLKQVRPPRGSLRLDQLALYTWSDDRLERQFKVVARVRLA